MQIVSVINDFSGRFDHHVVNQGMSAVNRGDSVSRCVPLPVCQFLDLKLHLKVSIVLVVEGRPVVYCEFITVLILMLPVCWSSNYIIQLEPQ